jgi:membrane protease YdiL (CAAX protease family)
MVAAVVIVGIVACVVAWRAVQAGRVSLWTSMPVLYAALGAAALLAGDIEWEMPTAFGVADPPSLATAIAAGLLLAVALWLISHLGTRLLLLRWSAFESSLVRDESRRTERPLVHALATSIVVAGGEELFWRGLMQAELGPWLDDRGVPSPFVVAAIAVWLAFALVLLASGSLPLLAGALIPGAVWAWLPLVTGGIVAGIDCHVGWTVLIVAFPPAARGRMMPA